MNTVTLIRRLVSGLAAACLILGVGGLAPAADAVRPPGTQAHRPVPRAFEYRGTFEVEVTHHVYLQYYDERDGRFIDASARMSGRIPTMIFTKSKAGIHASMDSVRSTVKALSGSVDSTTTTNQGRTEVRCQGDSIRKTNKQYPYLAPDAQNRLWFYPFGIASLPQTCRDNEGGEPVKSVHSLPGIATKPRLSDGRPGDKHVTLSFSGKRTYAPDSPLDQRCPDEAASLTVECSYQVTGKIRLTRVRVY